MRSENKTRDEYIHTLGEADRSLLTENIDIEERRDIIDNRENYMKQPGWGAD